MKVQSSEIGAIVERLEVLERHNQRLKQLLALVCVLAGSFFFIGAGKKGHVVQTTEFLLKDADGRVRAALRMGSAGPYLAFYNPDGKAAQALLGVLPSGPALGLYDAKGKTRVSLGVSAKGANLTFHDSDERLRAELGMLEEGPNLLFLEPDGKPVYKVR